MTKIKLTLLGLIALFFASNSFALELSIPATKVFNGTCVSAGFVWPAFKNEPSYIGCTSITAVQFGAVVGQTLSSATISTTGLSGSVITKWWATNTSLATKNYPLIINESYLYSCTNLAYPTLQGEICLPNPPVICSDGFYATADGVGTDCSRSTPHWPEEINICLNGETPPPEWPACSEGLDDAFVHGVDADVEKAKQNADEVLQKLIALELADEQMAVEVAAINAAAAAAESSKNDAVTDSVKVDTLVTDNPTIPTLSEFAEAAQQGAIDAIAAAASADATATDNAVRVLNSQQALTDARKSSDDATIAAAAAANARATLDASNSRAEADAKAAAAASAAATAAAANTALTNALSAISNSVIQSSNAAIDAATAATNAANAATAAATAATNAANAVASGGGGSGDSGTGDGGTGEGGTGDGDGTGTGEGDGGTGDGTGDGDGECTGEDCSDDVAQTGMQNAPSAGLTSFYTSSYENGFAGVFETNLTAIKQTALFKSVNNFGGENLIAGVLPSWTLCFDAMGCHTVSVPAYVWGFMRLVILISAGFLCRSLIFGG